MQIAAKIQPSGQGQGIKRSLDDGPGNQKKKKRKKKSCLLANGQLCTYRFFHTLPHKLKFEMKMVEIFVSRLTEPETKKFSGSDYSSSNSSMSPAAMAQQVKKIAVNFFFWKFACVLIRNCLKRSLLIFFFRRIN